MIENGLRVVFGCITIIYSFVGIFSGWTLLWSKIKMSKGKNVEKKQTKNIEREKHWKVKIPKEKNIERLKYRRLKMSTGNNVEREKYRKLDVNDY